MANGLNPNGLLKLPVPKPKTRQQTPPTLPTPPGVPPATGTPVNGTPPGQGATGGIGPAPGSQPQPDPGRANPAKPWEPAGPAAGSIR